MSQEQTVNQIISPSSANMGQHVIMNQVNRQSNFSPSITDLSNYIFHDKASGAELSVEQLSVEKRLPEMRAVNKLSIGSLPSGLVEMPNEPKAMPSDIAEHS